MNNKLFLFWSLLILKISCFAQVNTKNIPQGNSSHSHVFCYTNPITRDTAISMRDYFIIKVGNKWYCTGTSNPVWTGHNPGVRLLVSDDLIHWKKYSWCIDASKLPADCPYNGRFWAPEIHFIKNKYWLTINSGKVTADDPKGMKTHSIWLFSSDKVKGPYPLINGPLTPQYNNDATLFEDEDGQTYLYCSRNGLFEAKIDLDSGKLTTPVEKFLDKRSPGNPDWTVGGIEAPFVIKKDGTYYSDLRAKYGHPQPYDVKIWDLGNEVDGAPWELGHKDADDYVKIAREAAKAMKAVDKTIKFVASGSSYYEPSGQWVDWNRKILSGLGDMISYISIQRYWEGGSPNDYYTFIGSGAMDFEEKIKVTADEIEAARAMNNFKNPINISVDEWGSFGRNFESVLPIAACLNSSVRHADVVKMANFTMMTSLLSNDPKKGTFKGPLFYAFRLFSNNCRGESVDTYFNCETFNVKKYKGIPYLDVTSVFNKDENAVFINVLNREETKPITADISNTAGAFSGKASATVINTDDQKAQFTFDKKNKYVPVTKDITTDHRKIAYTFPPHSFTQIKVNINSK